MLTQEDSTTPNMSVDASPLRRSSWKAEAIRRGNLKISGPIPITEDVPLSDEEVKDFEKHEALSPKLPQDTPVVRPSQPIPESPFAPPPAPPVVQGELYSQTSVPPADEPKEQGKIRSSPPPQQLSVPMQTTPERHRRSATEPMPISPIPPTPETPTRAAARKKRKSGLRNVFRKMFGRRSREESDGDEGQLPQQSRIQRQSQRASDIAITRASPERKIAMRRRGPISDLDVEERTPMNPLGQHLPFPMNVNAPQEASPPHAYLRFEMPSPDTSRRRATLPNVHGISETQSLNGQEKRHDTWRERTSGEYITSPEIGVALSSPPPGERQSTQSAQEKRRSRSAGNLREITKGKPPVERRRSAEIRYWRSSYASGSVYSTNTPRPRTAQTVETVRSIEAQEELPELSEMVTKSVSVHAPTVVAHHDHDHDTSQVPLPVEAFNFGNFRSDFSDDDDSEQPAEEPAAPSVHPERRLSIEDRVKHLEENVRSLDASVRRMSGRNNRQTIILENAPKGRRSRNRSSSAASQRQGSHHSSKDSHNTLHLRQYEDEKPAPDSPLYPLSAVNGLPVSNAAQKGVADIHAQLAALQFSLQHERNARKALEAHVSTLQRDLADLHNLVHKFVSAASPSYPTPSPDAIIASNEASTPRASELRGRERAISESSTDDGDDTVSPDDWATPKESVSSGFF
ncbi:hypothetical protein PMIN04_004593 [Paraphaeosphaeria minitans]